MKNYKNIIELLESIKTNELDTVEDYDIVELLNDTIFKIESYCIDNKLYK